MKTPKYKIFLFLFFSLYSFNASTQNKTIDSLQKILGNQKEDTAKINTLNALASEVIRNRPDSAIYFSNKALQLSTKLNYKPGIGDSYLQLGQANVALGNSEEALKNCNDAIDLYDQINNLAKNPKPKFLEKKSSALIIIGNMYAGKGNYSEALKNYYAALQISESNGIKINTAAAYGNIGNIYDLQGNDSEALKNSFSSLKIYEEINNKEGIAQNYGNIGGIYGELGNYAEALKNYSSSLKIAEKIGNKYIMADAHNGSADIYALQGNYSQSLKVHFTALKILEEIKDKRDIIYSYYHIGGIYTKQKQNIKAFKYLSKGLSLAKGTGSLDELESGYYNLTLLDSALGNYKKAYENYRLYTLYRDSATNKETTKKTLQSKMQYEFDKKEALIKAAQDRKDADAKRIKNQQYLAIASLVVVVLAVVIIAFIQFKNNKQKQKANLLITQQKEKVESTLSELKSTQKQLIQSEKMASLGELTAGIAHEIQNPLNFVNNFSETNVELLDELIQEGQSGNMPSVLEVANDIKVNEQKINHHGRRADSIVKGMLEHSRTSSGQKEPTDINKLADEYLRLSYHGMRAKDKSFNANVENWFDESIGTVNIIPQEIGRVLLNLFNNAFYAVNEKKKQVSEGYDPTVAVSTKKMDGKIEVRVADNGMGISKSIVDKIFQPFFTTKPTGQGTGLGLSLSYDIVNAHGGELKVDSTEGEGTVFIIQLPV